MLSVVARKRLAVVLAALSVAGAGCTKDGEGSGAPNEQSQADLEQVQSNIRNALAAKNYGDAAVQAKTAQAAFPTSPEIHLLAAQAEGYLGNSGNAAAAFQRAVETGLADPRAALADPSFNHVRSDESFGRLRASLSPARADIRAKSAAVAGERIRAGDVEIVEDETGSYVRAGDVVLDIDQ